MFEYGQSLPVLGPGVPHEGSQPLYGLDVVGEHVEARLGHLGPKIINPSGGYLPDIHRMDL